MRYIKALSIIAFTLVISACGNSGRGSESKPVSGSQNYSINVITEDIALTLESDQTKDVTVSVEYQGDGVIIGVPEGKTIPNWLSVHTDTAQASPALIKLNIYTYGLQPGEYRTTLLFLSGKQDGSVVVQDELPITITVKPPNIAPNNGAFGLTYSADNNGTTAPWPFKVYVGEEGKTWRLTVDYPPGETEGWLELSQSEGEDGLDQFTEVYASVKPLPNGNYSAELNLHDGSGKLIDSIPVDYYVSHKAKIDVSKSDFVINKNTQLEDLNFTVTIDPAHVLGGENSTWQLTSSEWINADVTSGDLRAVQTIELSLDVLAILTSGESYNYGHISINSSRGEISDFYYTIFLTEYFNPKLIIGSPTVTTFNEQSPDLTGSLSITLEGAQFGLNTGWQATSQTPWLQLLTSEGDTLQNNILQYQVNVDQLPGTYVKHTGYINIATVSNLYANDKTVAQIPFTIDAPMISATTPQVAYEGTASNIAISGKRFISGKEYSLNIQDQIITATAISDSVLQTKLPSTLNASNTSITLENTLKTDDPPVDIEVKRQHIWQASRTVLEGFFDKISLDPVRSAIYFTGYRADQLQRLNYSEDNSWENETFNLPGLQAIELLASGDELVAVFSEETQAEYAAYLNPVTLQVNRIQGLERVVFKLTSEPLRSAVLPLLNNQPLITVDGLPSGIYDLALDEYLAVSFNPPGPLAGVFSRDRTRAFFTEEPGSSGSLIINAATGLNTSYNFSPGSVALKQQSYNSSGSKLLIKDQLLDGQLQLLGHLTPERAVESAAITPNGQQAFAQHYNNEQAIIYRHDVSGDDARGQYPADELPLTSSIMAGETIQHLVVSEDGAALFVLSYSKKEGRFIFYVIPLKGNNG